MIKYLQSVISNELFQIAVIALFTLGLIIYVFEGGRCARREAFINWQGASASSEFDLDTDGDGTGDGNQTNYPHNSNMFTSLDQCKASGMYSDSYCECIFSGFRPEFCVQSQNAVGLAQSILSGQSTLGGISRQPTTSSVGRFQNVNGNVGGGNPVVNQGNVQLNQPQSGYGTNIQSTNSITLGPNTCRTAEGLLGTYAPGFSGQCVANPASIGANVIY